MLSAD